MMANDTEQIILTRLDKIDRNIESIQVDLNMVKSDIGSIKERQAGLTTDIGWIKVLFTVAAGIFTVLLGALITYVISIA